MNTYYIAIPSFKKGWDVPLTRWTCALLKLQEKGSITKAKKRVVNIRIKDKNDSSPCHDNLLSRHDGDPLPQQKASSLVKP